MSSGLTKRLTGEYMPICRLRGGIEISVEPRLTGGAFIQLIGRVHGDHFSGSFIFLTKNKKITSFKTLCPLTGIILEKPVAQLSDEEKDFFQACIEEAFSAEGVKHDHDSI
ncbi:hypothetical protein [Bdellovibrio bacteriovorus]|uniref:hypothetical protein n=1 Tax=Bdellovibrio bacteriovorus TaxID=959 RepID=UPI0035A65198